MDAVHQEDASWTIETLVVDLTNGIMYLYYFYQYDVPVIINVKDELANPREAGPLSKLFPEDVQQEAAKRYKQVTKVIRTIPCDSFFLRIWSKHRELFLNTLTVIPIYLGRLFTWLLTIGLTCFVTLYCFQNLTFRYMSGKKLSLELFLHPETLC